MTSGTLISHQIFANASGAMEQDVAVMANCQSGILAHYLGLADRTYAEQWPDIFTLATRADSAGTYSKKYRHLVYGIFIEYNAGYWPNGFDLHELSQRLQLSLAAWTADGAVVQVIIPPSGDLAALTTRTGEQCSFTEINDAVLAIAEQFPVVRVIKIANFVEEAADVSVDRRHYSRTILRRVAEHLRDKIIAEAYVRSGPVAG